MHSNQTKILILNGPNLNLLGSREPIIYGSHSLEQIKRLCETRATELNVEIDFIQTNHEGEMLEHIHDGGARFQGIVLNPAAYSHTSVALLDAVLAVDVPVVEVHLSNIHKREEYRKKSFVSFGAAGVIFGFGATGYILALDGLVAKIGANKMVE